MNAIVKVNDFPARLFRLLMLLSMVLLAFSTTKEQGGVVTFASPFLGLLVLLLLPIALFRFPKIDGYAFVIAIAYILVMGVASLLAAELLQSMVRYFYYLVAVCIFCCVLAVYPRLGVSQDYLARMILLAGFSLSAYFIGNVVYQSMQHNFIHVIYERQVGGLMSLPWGASNVVAQVLLLSMFSALFIERKDFATSFFMMTIFLTILITMSRSVFVLSLPLLVLYFGLTRFLIIMAIFIAFMAYALWNYAIDLVDLSSLQDLIQRRTNTAELLSGNDRFSLSYSKIEYFLRHPFEPIGFYSSLHTFQSTAHNYWVTTLVEQSLFALLVSTALFLLFFARASLLGKQYGFGFFLIMVGLSVEDPQFTQQYTVMLWLVFLLIQISYEQRVKQRGVF
jgi:hypothetical protein